MQIKLSENPEDVYTLHGVVLALHSPFFKASLSERWAESGDTALITPGSSIRWRYELKFDKNSNLAILTREVSGTIFVVRHLRVNYSSR